LREGIFEPLARQETVIGCDQALTACVRQLHYFLDPAVEHFKHAIGSAWGPQIITNRDRRCWNLLTACLQYQALISNTSDVPQHVVACLLPETMLERHVHDLVRENEQNLVIGQLLHEALVEVELLHVGRRGGDRRMIGRHHFPRCRH
jgi:hypothetical protein